MMFVENYPMPSACREKITWNLNSHAKYKINILRMPKVWVLQTYETNYSNCHQPTVVVGADSSSSWLGPQSCSGAGRRWVTIPGKNRNQQHCCHTLKGEMRTIFMHGQEMRAISWSQSWLISYHSHQVETGWFLPYPLTACDEEWSWYN